MFMFMRSELSHLWLASISVFGTFLIFDLPPFPAARFRFTVVSGQLNVVKGLNEEIKLSVLEEIDM
jgi:hypothetical protein